MSVGLLRTLLQSVLRSDGIFFKTLILDTLVLSCNHPVHTFIALFFSILAPCEKKEDKTALEKIQNKQQEFKKK